MSSTDPTTIGVHRALHEALNSAREARHHLDDGDAAPDLDDLVELGIRPLVERTARGKIIVDPQAA